MFTIGNKVRRLKTVILITGKSIKEQTIPLSCYRS